MAFKKLIIFIFLLFAGLASATTTTIQDRTEYSRSLNSVATVMMNWYGSLIENSDGIVFSDIGFSHNQQAQAYRSQYPKHITQILITKTKLLKLNDRYQFNVTSKINYKKNNKAFTKIFSETFLFENLLSKHPNIKSAHVNSSKEVDVFTTTAYDAQHYKVREFVYAWLAYIDGVDTLTSVMNAEAWINTASYELDMGALKAKGLIDEVLAKRKDTLAKGGHLLRSLEMKKTKGSNNHFVIDLIIEWKGFNTSGKPVIARINQVLTIRIKKDKSWEIISIKEKHLLPITVPWVGMLC